MKSGLGRVVKVAVIVVGIAAVALSASVALTDPSPSTLPMRVGRWLTARSWRAAPARPSAPPAAHRGPEPPFSDITFDDSGYATAIRFSKPIADPTSLAQIRDSVVGRAGAGSPTWRTSSPRLPPGDPATPSTAAEHPPSDRLAADVRGGVGARPSDAFARAQAADPARPAPSRANMDALRGVAALRRGEVENCVACCNEASCIFPLDRPPPSTAGPPARARRSSTSRRYLRQTARGPGRPLAPERRLHDARRVPGRPSRPNSSCRWAGSPRRGRPATDGQRRLARRAQRPGRVDGRRLPGRRLRRRRTGSTSSCPRPTPSAGRSLLRNRGDGTVRGRLRPPPAWPTRSSRSTPAHADYDNDGRLDVLMLRGAWEVPRRMSLLRNRGGPSRTSPLGRRPGRADRLAGGRLGRLRQRRPRRPVRRRRVRSPASRPSQPGPALPQPGRRHVRRRRRGGRRDQRSVRQGGRLGRLRRRRPSRPVSSPTWASRGRLYHNQGDGTFARRRRRARA